MIVPRNSYTVQSDAAPAELSAHHRETLRGSAIAPEVAAERGYTSVTAADPRLAPFASYQRADGLLFPIRPPDGGNGLYQLRRDRERIVTDRETGKQHAARYEQPAGQPHRLDVHPRSVPALADPAVPLYVSEGVKKGDSLTTAGRCAVALGGVWCFRQACIPDWELIALRGRTVVIVFDSDAESNPNVGKARDVLAEFLAERGARVRILRVPAGPNGEKWGIDDFLGAGGDLADLLATNCSDWTPPGPCPLPACVEARTELAERREVARLEARILTAPKGTGIAPNRRIPALLFGRRYFSDVGRERLQPERRAVVDEDGWDRIPLKSWSADNGIGYAVLLDTRKELVASGMLEARERKEVLPDGRTIDVTDTRTTAGSYKEWLAGLVTVAQAPRGAGWGGARYRCPDHPEAGTRTKHVCALCGRDAEPVEGTDFKLENRSGTPGSTGEAASAPPTGTNAFKLENRSAAAPHDQEDGADHDRRAAELVKITIPALDARNGHAPPHEPGPCSCDHYGARKVGGRWLCSGCGGVPQPLEANEGGGI